MASFFLQNVKFETQIVLENNVTGDKFRIFKSCSNIILLIFVKIVNKILKETVHLPQHVTLSEIAVL